MHVKAEKALEANPKLAIWLNYFNALRKEAFARAKMLYEACLSVPCTVSMDCFGKCLEIFSKERKLLGKFKDRPKRR